jgi:DNA-binding NtrC family response regulator
MLFEHRWEGNFRELANFADRFRGGDDIIDSTACKRALMGVALDPGGPASARPSEPGLSAKWGDLAQQAASAFFEDFGREARSWDDLKGYIEQYLKPLLFAHLSGADLQHGDVEPRQLAHRINADRGTAYKQLARYRERFRR